MNRGTKHTAAADEPGPPKRILEGIEAPRVLIGTNVEEIRLTFEPDVDFAKVRFEVVNKEIRITRKGRPANNGVYEHNLLGGDDRVQSYEMSARTIKEESRELVEVLFFGKRRDQLLHREAFTVILKPAVALPDKVDPIAWLKWLTSKLEPLPKGLRYSILGCAAMAGLVWALVHFSILPEDFLKRFLAAPHASNPRQATLDWTDQFGGNSDRPDLDNWDAPPEWKLQPIRSQLNALIVSGTEVGIIKLHEDNASLYDCDVDFTLLVMKDQRSASWVLRAQSKRDYCLFEMVFAKAKGDNASFRGYVYKNGEKVRNMNGQTDPLDYWPFDEGDRLAVHIQIRGGEFLHRFTLTDRDTIPGAPPAPPGIVDPKSGTPCERRFSDATYACGLLGFKADLSSDLKIRDLRINVHPRPD